MTPATVAPAKAGASSRSTVVVAPAKTGASNRSTVVVAPAKAEASNRSTVVVAPAKAGAPRRSLHQTLLRTLALALALAPTLASAQTRVRYDPTKPPTLGKPAPLIVPAVATSALPNGIGLRIVEDHELPLVQVIATIHGGSLLDGDAPGLATFTSGMLDEGAGSRDAAALQSELAYLGATLVTNASWDGFTVGLKVPVRSLGPALDLMADVLLRPTLSAGEVRRQRDLRVAAL
ncbi:MAG: insulinase family protein, partial [Cytophagaceae bacterium]|nr:insulinase family protein [Gemmatimonadaceae bacterium]